jgi:predicted metalloprotease with PDZ domain
MSLNRVAPALAPAILYIFIFAFGPLLHAQTPPGTIHISVDATQAPQKILHAKLEIPVQPGPLTLYYPAWIPGEHAPDGPVTDLAGLKFTAGGKTISWRRDLVDMFAFHLDVPPGENTLDVDLDFLLSAPASGFSAGASATAQLDLLSWNQVLLYPKGWTAAQLTFEASLRLPDDWKFGTALPVKRHSGDEIDFEPVSLETLVDSPVIAGHFFRVIQLTPGQKPPHEIDIAADSEAALAMPPETEMHYKQLVAETGALWRARHYRDYHFLLTLSDDVAHFGLEHHESSDDRVPERSLIDDAERLDMADLLPHEFTHSWNGKYRRPAGLATPDYQQPMKGDLLWVYEGLTEYLGKVLAARSGLFTPEQFDDNIAYIASTYDYRSGRTWRPLQDTADAAQLLYFANTEWENWRRSTDYYDEGALIWLDVDTAIRQLTHDQKSIEDFCRSFEGAPGGAPALKTYTFDDIVSALNSVAPNDWHSFLRTRLDSTSPHAPLGGIEHGGWKLVYNDRPNDFITNGAETHNTWDYMSSLGLSVQDDGTVIDVVHDGPAYNAGIGPGMKLTAIDGQQFSSTVLRELVEKSASASAPFTFLVANGPYFKTMTVDYRGGPRYPHLERNNEMPDLLGEIIRPLAPGSATGTEAAAGR